MCHSSQRVAVDSGPTSRLFCGHSGGSPNLRIAIPALLLSGALTISACSKLGLGDDSPSAPSGPPPAGSTITYSAIGASDANGVGSSVVCLPWTECPNGTGYPFVAARQLQSQGFKVAVTNLGIPTAVIGPGNNTVSASKATTPNGWPFPGQGGTTNSPES